MDRQSLLDLLNIKPKDVATQATVACSPKQATVASQEPSRYALQLDLFDQQQGGKLLRHNHHLRVTNLEPDAVSDLFALNFLACPQKGEAPCVDQRRQEYITETMDSPDYQALHRQCELNYVASELATVELAKGLAKLKGDDKKREDKAKEAQAKGKRVDPDKEAKKADLACMSAVAGALKKADKEVEDLQETMTALGCGSGQGNVTQMDIGKITNTFQRVKDNATLRRIMELAGRYRRTAQAKQRQKTLHGVDDVVGVVLDGDVSRLLPHELAMLSIPELEWDTMRRLVERQCMSREYRGVEKIGKGPIIIVVDESGSMDGEPLCNAKSFALAMAWVAQHQNRYCALVGFSGGTEGTRLMLPPKKWDETRLVEWLAHNYSGGTDCDVPCKELPQTYWPEFVAQGMKRGKTDIIIISDGVIQVPPDVVSAFNTWKQQEKVRVISLMIGYCYHQGLECISDENYSLVNIDLNQEAVQRCLSV